MEYYSFVDFANILNNQVYPTDKTALIYNIKELYDSYTKYLMIKKYNIEIIKNKRMHAVINNYIDFYSVTDCNKDTLEKDYMDNVTDNLKEKTNYITSFFANAQRYYNNYENEKKIEIENCDIISHYNNINKKYEYYSNLKKNSEVITEDTCESYLYEDIYEEDIVSCSYNSDDYYYTYDNFSDDESDYYSDE